MSGVSLPSHATGKFFYIYIYTVCFTNLRMRNNYVIGTKVTVPPLTNNVCIQLVDYSNVEGG